MRIAARDIGPDHTPYVIAELGVNHDGDPARALDLVRLAADAGADAIKLQLFRADMLMSKAAKLAAYQKSAGETDPVEMLRRLELPIDAMKPCVALAHELGIHAIVSVFSVELVPVTETLPWDAYKTASPDIINKPLLDALAATDKPLIVSTGASTMEEVVRAVRWLQPVEERLAVLHCVSCYPTPMPQANPFGVQALMQVFPGPVGYSDHTTSVQMGRFMMGCRAVILEKHFTHSKHATGPDHAASLEPAEFREYASLARTAWQRHFEAREMLRTMTEDIRRQFERDAPGALELVARGAFGLDPEAFGAKAEKFVLPIEQDVRTVSRQSLTTTRALPAGHALARADLTIKRPGIGIPPYELDTTIGRRLARAVETDTPLRPENLA